ncbi:iduronate 2-sulfatase isoform X1 [Microplitis mediator]|uniref:iduronate 2-sulfatase isoform X1 n=1 Tax=Microplitis mediator TaxID=375433 RepID=UPI0025528324|nr:iduronate 2-sulfatase isoform X1 [Microplitis mediator]
MCIIKIVLLTLVSLCKAKQNILFIMVDDLRPAMGCYGDKNAYTPHIDNLADKSVVFTRAYAQQSLCAPSRNSLLTSRRPDTLRLYDFYSYWRNDNNFTTLPQYLKANGYITKSIGKIFHPGVSSNYSDDSPYSWTEIPFHPLTDRYKNAPICPTARGPARNLICPVKMSSMPHSTLPDIENLNAAKNFLSNHSVASPFFLAVGFEKPHIPFKFPGKFLKYHPVDKFHVKNYFWPGNVSSVAYNPWIDLRKRDDVEDLNLKFPWEKIPKEFAVKIIQSYYASVSYVDYLVGKLIKQLINMEIDKNTVVVLTSDHGWSLGEHSLWGKYSNFDVAVRVPLIVSLPKMKNKVYSRSIVELVDLFPTIAELGGIPIDTCGKMNDNLCTEGQSFVPVLKAAAENKVINWKKAAFSQYPRPGLIPTWKPNSDEPRFKNIKIMGYSLRTSRYRYTAWVSFNKNSSDWENLIAQELYDHSKDPHEMTNQQANIYYSKIKNKLFKLLKAGWREAMPR